MPHPTQNLGLLAQLACLWEATARKPGNAHRFADLNGLSYVELLSSSAAIGATLDKAWFRPVGEIVLEAVKATRGVVRTNTNLGIILTLTPLASVVPGRPMRTELPKVLRNLTIADAVLTYEAIRAAEPGGMGRVSEQDIADVPTITLRDAMALAEDRDRIAWQYTHDFTDVFEIGVSALTRSLDSGRRLEDAVIDVQVSFLAAFRDSLIERKHGTSAADAVVAAARTSDPAALDDFLRSRGWNPGTSADLTAASLFVGLREGIIPLPHPRW